jgi:hypothetical protein
MTKTGLLHKLEALMGVVPYLPTTTTVTRTYYDATGTICTSTWSFGSLSRLLLISCCRTDTYIYNKNTQDTTLPNDDGDGGNGN